MYFLLRNTFTPLRYAINKDPGHFSHLSMTLTYYYDDHRINMQLDETKKFVSEIK